MGTQKERNKQWKGVEWRGGGDQRAWKVGGCLQLPFPLHKDFQMCSCSGRGLQQSPLYQPSTRILYRSQNLTSSTLLPLSHLTPPSPNCSQWQILKLALHRSSLSKVVVTLMCETVRIHICFFWRLVKNQQQWLSPPILIPHSDCV